MIIRDSHDSLSCLLADTESAPGDISTGYVDDATWSASSHGAWYVCVPIAPLTSPAASPATSPATSAPTSPRSPGSPRSAWETGVGGWQIDYASTERAAKGYQPLVGQDGEVSMSPLQQNPKQTPRPSCGSALEHNIVTLGDSIAQRHAGRKCSCMLAFVVVCAFVLNGTVT